MWSFTCSSLLHYNISLSLLLIVFRVCSKSSKQHFQVPNGIAVLLLKRLSRRILVFLRPLFPLIVQQRCIRLHFQRVAFVPYLLGGRRHRIIANVQRQASDSVSMVHDDNISPAPRIILSTSRVQPHYSMTSCGWGGQLLEMKLLYEGNYSVYSWECRDSMYIYSSFDGQKLLQSFLKP